MTARALPPARTLGQTRSNASDAHPVSTASTAAAPIGNPLAAQKYADGRDAALKWAKANGYSEECLVELPVQWGEQGESGLSGGEQAIFQDMCADEREYASRRQRACQVRRTVHRAAATRRAGVDLDLTTYPIHDPPPLSRAATRSTSAGSRPAASTLCGCSDRT